MIVMLVVSAVATRRIKLMRIYVLKDGLNRKFNIFKSKRRRESEQKKDNEVKLVTQKAVALYSLGRL